MRSTRQRDLILKIVRSSRSHPTADWIYQEARKQMPNISLGTVYRNLKLLAQRGQIIAHRYGANPTRYESNTAKHYHIRCVACGRVEDLPLSVLKGVERRVSRSVNYRVLEHRLEVLGTCADCSEAVEKVTASRGPLTLNQRGGHER